MHKQDLVSIRGGRLDDVNFILATWLRGLYHGSNWFGLIPRDIFMRKYHALLERLLRTEGLTVTVACLKDDTDVVLGYAVSTGGCLHYIFVKKAWRKIGLGKSLLPKDLKSVSHLTEVGRSLLRKHPSVYFDPFQ